MSAKHTAGPWRWQLNESSKSLQLVGGRPEFDLTIIEPVRWGMGSATLFVRDTAHDGMNLLHKLHERRDWIAPFPNRVHHAKWCVGIKHPDMQLIEAAPDLLEALQKYSLPIDINNIALSCIEFGSEAVERELQRRAAIAKATGSES